MGFKDKVVSRLRILNYNRKTTQFRKEHVKEWRTAARDIAPSTYKNNPGYIICGKTRLTYFVIAVTRGGETGSPKKLTASVLNRLMNIDIGNYSIGLTTAIVAIPNYEAAKSLHSLESDIVANQVLERDGHNGAHVSADTTADLKDVTTAIQIIHDQSEKMRGQAIILSILSETEEDMDIAIGQVEQVFGSTMVRMESPDGMMELAMQTALPFPVIPNRFQSDPLSNTAAIWLAAQDVNVHTDNRGLRLGYRKGDPAQQVMVNLEELPAGHILLVGQTGSGKTTAFLAYLYRLFTELGYNCIMITAKKDEKTNQENVAREAGKDGAIINIGPDDLSVNPLQIVYDEDNITTLTGWADAVHEQINTVTQFFSVYLEEGMSAPKKSYINRTMIELYEKYGIFVDRPETLKEALRTVEYPLMEDLIAIWEKDLKAGLGGDLQKTVQSMINNTFQLGPKGAFNWLNRASNIDISKKFIVIDVSSISDTKMREAMNVFITRIMWQKSRTGKKDKPYTAIVIDEGRDFFNNPTTRDSIVDQLRKARSDKVFLGIMVQEPQDIIRSGVWEEVLTNTFVKIIFGPDKDESKVAVLAKHFNFTKEQTRDLVLCSTGQAMIQIRGKVTPVEIKLTKHELGMINGDNLRSRKEAENQLTVGGIPIDERMIKIVEENGFCISSWIKEDQKLGDDYQCDAEDYFTNLKWARDTFSSALSAGTVRGWVRSGLIINGKIGAQSRTHYATVMQIAGHLLMNGISETTVQHTSGVDVSARIGDELFAFEFETPASHRSGEALRDKQKRAVIDHAVCYFIGTSENVKFLRQEVISQNVFQRGVNLRRLLDTLIEVRQ